MFLLHKKGRKSSINGETEKIRKFSFDLEMKMRHFWLVLNTVPDLLVKKFTEHLYNFLVVLNNKCWAETLTSIYWAGGCTPVKKVLDSYKWSVLIHSTNYHHPVILGKKIKVIWIFLIRPRFLLYVISAFFVAKGKKWPKKTCKNNWILNNRSNENILEQNFF